MIDEATCNFGTGQCTAKKCVTVTVGASDVPVECFAQESHGQKLGPLGGGWIDRNFKTAPVFWTGAAPCKPLVVPFAFFVNDTVTKGGNPITNITRDNAELIFSGQVYDWRDIADVDGALFDQEVIAVCLRHAGSGTHASIDAYLDSALINREEVAADHKFYHNNGSSDMMKCVNGSGTWTGSGAIGYADADQSLSSYPNISILDLNGVAPSENTIKHGAYNFYGLQQLYGVSASDPFCSFAGNPANISNPVWVARCKMNYSRADGCEAFGLQYVTPTCP
jgi:ABC-type phosphate transport system substrate-binding protein